MSKHLQACLDLLTERGVDVKPDARGEAIIVIFSSDVAYALETIASVPDVSFEVRGDIIVLN